MPLFAFPTGVLSTAAEYAASDLQAWLDLLNAEEYLLLSENLAADPSAGDRPMVSRANAVIDRLKILYEAPAGESNWGLVVKNQL